MEIRDQVFCFVGKFAASTKPLQRRLDQAGARVTSFDDVDATVLVLGTKAKSKERAARKRGLTIVTMHEVEEALAGPLPPSPPVQSGPAGPKSPNELTVALHAVAPSNGHAIGELLSQARANGVVVDLARGGDSAGSGAPVWLLAWCSDADGCEFFVIPESSLDAGRRADLLAVAGLCFANSADASPEQLGAAIRLIAARTFVGKRDPGELAGELFAGWSAELEGSEERAGVNGVDDLRGHVGWLLEFGVRAEAQIRRAFKKVIAVNRAM